MTISEIGDISANVNASAEYEIQCSCVIGFSNNFMFANSAISTKNQFITGFVDTKQHYYLQQPHIGGYYSSNWYGKYDTTD
ncbi:hypothetical protein QE152_g29887 [Popillia japonica]|uniref:Uncharacterized protein n=1 Tax=Popillia japonica TaxID=7064 RepID=A0AAW1JG30_POPJA